jgi:hypothetical protein
MDTGSETVDQVLDEIRQRLNLEAETEHEVLEEIRGHLEYAVANAEARGLDERAGLAQAAARFGIVAAARELQAAHAGRGTLNGIAAAALPVLFALLLRWLIFAPAGTAVGWHEALERPALWAVAGATLMLPWLRFPRRRWALAIWAVFWGLSLVSAVGPALRW